MSPFPMPLTKRLGAALAVFLFFVNALPVTAVCCAAKSRRKTASMSLTMPCCAESCRLTTADTTRDRDVTLASTSSLKNPTTVVVAMAAPASPARGPAFDAVNERTPPGLSPPPPFLLQHQFRI